MDFTQLLSIAQKNAKKQEVSVRSNGVVSTKSMVANVGKVAAAKQEKKSSVVNNDAVKSYLDQKKQSVQDREREMIEQRRKLLEQRLEKRKTAKQKEKEERMAMTMETLRAEERKKQTKYQPLVAVKNDMPKNNIKAQFSQQAAPLSCAKASKPPPAPTQHNSAPLDYQTLMKMAANRKDTPSPLIEKPPIKPQKPKLDDEEVHLKPLTNKSTTKGQKAPSCKTTASVVSKSNLPSLPPSSKGKGIAAQMGVGMNIAGAAKPKQEQMPPPQRRQTNGYEDIPKSSSVKGIAAQFGTVKSNQNQDHNSSNLRKSSAATPQWKSEKSSKSSEERHRKESPEVSCPKSFVERKPKESAAPMPAGRGRGIAAQLGVSVSAKRRYEEDFERYEDEDEYDSELDGFIVDELDEDELDDGYGSHHGANNNVDEALMELRKVTGYDPTKFRDRDISDVELRRSMTASFSDILKEEKRSERIGKKEDAEEFRKEQERLKKKLGGDGSKRPKMDLY